jgi:hypothetical protein
MIVAGPGRRAARQEVFQHLQNFCASFIFGKLTFNYFRAYKLMITMIINYARMRYTLFNKILSDQIYFS